MWFLNILAIGFICNNIMSVESVREKPIRIIKQTSIPREKPSSPKKTPIAITYDDVIKTPKPLEIFDEVGSSDDDHNRPINIRTLTKIPLSTDSDSDESPIAPTKTKHFKKHRTKTPISSDITETITDISQTVTDTLGDVKKTVLVGILKQIIKSKQFTIILVLGTIFIGIGYIAKIIWSK